MNIENLFYAFLLLIFLFTFIRIASKNHLWLELTPKNTHDNAQVTFLYWASPVLFVAIWGVISSSELLSISQIPSPIKVAEAFYSLILSGELPKHAFISFQRIVIGFGLASLIGVSIGLITGSFLLSYQLIVPINSFLRYIPPTAFIALLIVYFGVGETFKYAAIFFGVVFFIIQMIVDIVDDLDLRYIEMGITSGFSNKEIFTKIIVPFSWPRILDVLRINLSAAWTFLVAAELIGAESGLGYLIATSQRFLRISELFAGIITFGIIGFLSDRSMDILSHKLLRWYYVEIKR